MTSSRSVGMGRCSCRGPTNVPVWDLWTGSGQ